MIDSILVFIKESELWKQLIGMLFAVFIFWIGKRYKDKSNEKGYQDALEEKTKFIKEMIKIIDTFEFRKKNLGLINNEDGRPIAEETIENIYAEYFVKIFEKLNEHKVYLKKDTFEKLESLNGNYRNYVSGKNSIMEEYSNGEEITLALKKLNENLLEKTSFPFNGLLENIKYKEREDIQKKLGL